MVKAAPIRYAFARDWPLKAYLGLCSALCLAAAVYACQPSPTLFKDWLYVLVFLAVIVVAPVLGFFLALPFAFAIVGPFYHLQACRNGSPFKPGDRVRVLVGPYRNRLTQVRSRWQGDSLRVELGPEADETYKDIFVPTQLLRVPDGEQIAPPEPPPVPTSGAPVHRTLDSLPVPGSGSCL